MCEAKVAGTLRVPLLGPRADTAELLCRPLRAEYYDASGAMRSPSSNHSPGWQCDEREHRQHRCRGFGYGDGRTGAHFVTPVPRKNSVQLWQLGLAPIEIWPDETPIASPLDSGAATYARMDDRRHTDER